MRCRASLAAAALTLVLILPGARPGAASGFRDLGQVPWAGPEITLLTLQGAMVGVSPWSFAPGAAISRQEVAVVLSRLLALSATTSLAPFGDHAKVAPWARSALAEAVAAGLIKGEGGLLAPWQPVTRAEAAVLLWRLAGEPQPAGTLSPFADQAAIPLWAAPAGAALSSLGVVTGFPGHLFAPQQPVSRAAFAVMLARLEPDLSSMPGLPAAVAGRVSEWLAPNQSTLAVQSQLVGSAGGVLLTTGRAWPFQPDASVEVAGTPQDLYALAAGDPVAAALAADGSITLLLDFGPGGSLPLTIENASASQLFLSNGQVLTVPGALSARLGGTTAAVLPSDLVGAVLASAPASPVASPLVLDQITLPDLSGVVVSDGALTMTVQLASSASPYLAAGSWPVTVNSATVFQGPDGVGSGPPPPGTMVRLLAILAANGQLTAQVVAW